MKAFNHLYYHKQLKTRHKSLSYFPPFFYPLDGIANWNRIYGKRGLLQYQFVVPYASGEEAFKEIFGRIYGAKKASFLAVLKNFGTIKSPGILSFPRPGYTLTLDFPFDGEPILKLLSELDERVIAYGGAVYPAKDARMSAAHFRKFFPGWETFLQHKDPAFSSSFWERVSHGS